MYWGTSTNIHNLTAYYPNNSYVMAPVDYYYLDCSFGNKYGGKSWCDPMKTWWRIYSFEPSDYLNDTRMLGSEVPVWSEIMSGESMHAKIWPRAAAMADKLWSPKVKIDLVAITQRQTHFKEYLINRGTPASPISGRWCEVIAEHCFGLHNVTSSYPESQNEVTEVIE